MKPLILFICCALTLTFANAQFSAGEQYISGSFSAGWSNNQPYNTTEKKFSIGFSPAFIRFKTDKKALGFRITTLYGQSKTNSGTYMQQLNQYGAGAGLFSQHYVSLGKGFYFFAGKGVKASYTSSKLIESGFSNNERVIHAYAINVYLQPGVGYQLTRRLLMNLEFGDILSLSYDHSKTRNTIGAVTNYDKSNSITLNSSLRNLSLGDIGISFGWRLQK